ncbi:MAG: hypothetical protein AAF222_10385 [Pseudomonadota bacterium]
MTHPLHSFIERLERRAERNRDKRALRQTQADPHLARDIGLPFKPARARKPELW